MTHPQNNSRIIGKASLFATAQVIAGLALLALSTHLALQSDTYLEVLNQSGLNQYHAFALLVCFSFFAGILLIAQQVLKYDLQEFEKLSSY